MAATVIDGKAVAASVRERVRGGVEELTGQLGRPPGLATVLVGDDPASAIYVRRKHEACEQAGIRSFDHKPDVGIAEEDLLALARGSEKVAAHLDGKEVVKEIVVPGKLVNLVVR